MKIGIIGLGYVGLPLAVEFGKIFSTVGFDINELRVKKINQGFDETGEVNDEILRSILKNNNSTEKGLFITHLEEELCKCDHYIITVPTPVNEYNHPDLNPMISATKLISKYVNRGDYIIYESTVYPGVCEDICVPIIENDTELKLNKDFFVGYSPERINPGDKHRNITNIVKVTSGSNGNAANHIDQLYKSIITAGTFLASSIKVAEAAKVIENAQRDINIAFMNELAKIFNLLEIDTLEVIEAASTKWNFLPFKPGLVGGHCIGVDPYYLAQKAISVGYDPEIILAGRKINESMTKYVSLTFLEALINKEIAIKQSRILILGFTFKENCPDHRNTKIIDLYHSLKKFTKIVDIYDPMADQGKVQEEFNIKLVNTIKGTYEGIILAVSHDIFLSIDLDQIRSEKSLIYDLKGFFPKEQVDLRL